jgi:carbonic anhydrase/acetyltransferase-like protein (isoleucine patch superfamily)
MIGISATLLDGAHVESDAILAAGSVLAPNKRVRSGEMWAGTPARLARPLKDQERGFIAFNAPHYAGLARDYLELGVGKP